jgi:hypothetical protein
MRSRFLAAILLWIVAASCVPAWAAQEVLCKPEFVGNFKGYVKDGGDGGLFAVGDFINVRKRAGLVTMELCLSVTPDFKAGYSEFYNRTSTRIVPQNVELARMIIPVSRDDISYDGDLFIICRLRYDDGKGNRFVTHYFVIGTIKK